MIRIRFISATVFVFLAIIFSSCKHGKEIRKQIRETDASTYAGTWLSIEGEDTLIVTLEAGLHFFEPFNRDIPQLYGSYNYTAGSSSRLEKLMVEEGAYTLEGGLINRHNPRPFIGFTYRDTEIDKSGGLRLYLDESNKNVLHWALFEYKDWTYPDTLKVYSVPDSLTLLRVDFD